MGFRYRWKPNATQRREYHEKCLAIEEAKSVIVNDGYDINCTGDCCKGDEIKFFNPAKSGEYLFGTIIAESYGAEKFQHTFTIEIESEKMKIKGRNLYKNGCLRKPWSDEGKRKEVIDEKHQRGEEAREKNKRRKELKEQKQFNELPSWRVTGDEISDRAVAKMQEWI
jgi:hypothetical protein